MPVPEHRDDDRGRDQARGERFPFLDRRLSNTGYRDRAFSSPTTGTAAPRHHTPWWEARDDSMATFLAAR